MVLFSIVSGIWLWLSTRLNCLSSWNFCGSKIWSKARMSSKMAAFRCTAVRGWFNASDVLVTVMLMSQVSKKYQTHGWNCKHLSEKMTAAIRNELLSGYRLSLHNCEDKKIALLRVVFVRQKLVRCESTASYSICIKTIHNPDRSWWYGCCQFLE